VRIHCSSSQRGNAAEIVNQATQALAVSFVDDLDNTRKHLDRFIVATNKTISANARHFIEEAIEGRRNLLLLDLDRLVELILEHRLAHYVLFSEWEHEEDVG
jgi:predicted SprT family Zn-dependent metalloprotease